MARKVNITALVKSREGSPEAKKRTELILRAMGGELTFDDAAGLLGIHVSLVYRLRDEILEAVIRAMEPGRPGRPRQEPEKSPREIELEEENARLSREAERARVSEELSVTLPHVVKRREELKEKKSRKRRRRG